MSAIDAGAWASALTARVEMMSRVAEPSVAGLSIVRRAATAVVTLDDAMAGNALSRAMAAGLSAAYARFARDPEVYAVILRSSCPDAFSVDAEFRGFRSGLADRAPTGPSAEQAVALCSAYRERLEFVWTHDCFSKPTVALIDGPVVGQGLGATLFGTHRVAGPACSLQFSVGGPVLIPDCGVLHPLAALAPPVARYLALTGRSLGPADAFRLGLATHCIASEVFADIEMRLADADPVDPVLDSLHRDPGEGELAGELHLIERYFSTGEITEILDQLTAPRQADARWCGDVLARLASRSQISLDLTLEALARARSLSVMETLRQDYRVFHHVNTRPAGTAQDDGLASYFADLGSQELRLAPRPVTAILRA